MWQDRWVVRCVHTPNLRKEWVLKRSSRRDGPEVGSLTIDDNRILANEGAGVEGVVERKLLDDGLPRWRVQRKYPGPVKVATESAETPPSGFMDHHVGLLIPYGLEW